MLIDNGEVIVEESSLAETINDHYINIVEKSSEQKPRNFASDTQIHWKMTSQILDQLVFERLFLKYMNLSEKSAYFGFK